MYNVIIWSEGAAKAKRSSTFSPHFMIFSPRKVTSALVQSVRPGEENPGWWLGRLEILQAVVLDGRHSVLKRVDIVV